MKPPFRREIQLLLHCASPPVDPQRSRRIYELSGESLDWEYLLETARNHKVTPLLFWELNAARPEAVPPLLAAEFQNNIRSNLLRVAELNQLLELLQRSGIAALPYKGPALAMLAYQNLALRTFVDLDIMVVPKDALRARSILIENGFASSLRLGSHREEAYLRAYDEFVLNGSDGHTMVEVHWAVTPRYFSVPLDVRRFWERSIPVRLGNRETPTLGLEDLLLVLCLHGTKHSWLQLSLIADVARLITRQEVRWADVLGRARDLGSVRMVLLGVELARRLLGISCPPVLQADISGRAVQSLANRVESQIFERNPDAERIVQAGKFHIQARERRRDRIRYIFRLATRAGVEDWQAVDLPRHLDFLYFFYRVPRLLRKYWGQVP